jgi:hypothetical protein
MVHLLMQDNSPEAVKMLDFLKTQPYIKVLAEETEEETIDISLSSMKRAIKDVKLLRQGKLKTIPAREALAAIKRDLAF